MRIEHVALYVNELEKARDFFVNHLRGCTDNGYHNKKTGFRSYFINFDDGARLELMSKPDMTDRQKDLNRTGYAHVAFSVGSKERVDELTARLCATATRSSAVLVPQATDTMKAVSLLSKETR